MWLDVIEIAVFLLILGSLTLSFKIFKISEQKKNIVFLCLIVLLSLIIITDTTENANHKLPIFMGLILAATGLVRKLKQKK
ncbi:hypothetical protein [Heyndrickxia camelliae]|uniref:Uncharacterized protein n=1 Tax=Heyndrickxia camelliae TaxID=1707093 RepID=A0A2N3LN70_9BACI|nr:hypothetical protein [Heyndrickxia camelliae]PKR86071.1 hypothetical protein CWO92_06785 [Heyndrickxia camelliae]